MLLIIFRSENKDFKSPGTWMNFTSGVMILEELCTIQWSTNLTIILCFCSLGWCKQVLADDLNPTIKISKSVNILRLCHALFSIEQSWFPENKVDYVHCKKQSLKNFFCLFSYWIVKFQMGNQFTATQMHFLNMVCTILHTDYVHFKKALLSLWKKINKSEQFIHIHMGLWIRLYNLKLSDF